MMDGGWRSFWRDPRDRTRLGRSLAVLVAVFTGFIAFLTWNETRTGYVFDDPVLRRFAPVSVSTYTMALTHGSFLAGWLVALRRPERLVRFVQCYALMILVRAACMFLVPLEPPPSYLALTDPILQAVIYAGRQNTKDLFFSGHTATIALLGFVFHDLRVRWLFFASAALIGVLLLAQHAHFSVDVLAAPFGSYAAIRLQRVLRRDGDAVREAVHERLCACRPHPGASVARVQPACLAGRRSSPDRGGRSRVGS